jgi:undecaprenyl-diphosphatase
MPEAAVKTKATQKVIAPPHQRHFRAAVFQTYILMASMVFVGLAVAAHFMPYFSIDLTVTRAVQSNHGALVDHIMRAISWVGFAPQAFILAFLVVAGLFFAGLRWESMSALFAMLNVAVGTLIKLIVVRPRPGADLVTVASKLNTYGFPSGHVLSITALGGYLAFLAFTLLKPSRGRTAITSFLGLIIILMGPSRIYLGHHWFSDVMGAYLLGSLWLALTIKFYRWGKERFFRRQPAAPEAPVAHESATAGAGG